MIPLGESSECCKRITYLKHPTFWKFRFVFFIRKKYRCHNWTYYGSRLITSLNNQRIFNDHSVDNTGSLCLSILPSSSHKSESHRSPTKYRNENFVLCLSSVWFTKNTIFAIFCSWSLFDFTWVRKEPLFTSSYLKPTFRVHLFRTGHYYLKWMDFCNYVVTLHGILAIWVKVQGVRLFFLPFDDRMHSDDRKQ